MRAQNERDRPYRKKKNDCLCCCSCVDVFAYKALSPKSRMCTALLCGFCPFSNATWMFMLFSDLSSSFFCADCCLWRLNENKNDELTKKRKRISDNSHYKHIGCDSNRLLINDRLPIRRECSGGSIAVGRWKSWAAGLNGGVSSELNCLFCSKSSTMNRFAWTWRWAHIFARKRGEPINGQIN